MRVLKFGGSSVSTPERIKHVGRLLVQRWQEKAVFCVVFSAFGGATDQLLEMAQKAAKGDENYKELLTAFKARHQTTARELLPVADFQAILLELHKNNEDLSNLLNGIYLTQELTARSSDYVVSFGERNAAFIIAAHFRHLGLPAVYMDARKLIATDKQFGNAKVNFAVTNEQIPQVLVHLEQHLYVVTGFIGAARGGLTTTLGRGGSDYTAAILAAGLAAEAIEIWTDVNGVLTADPRKVKKAFSILQMTFAEAMEMSHFGAKVIYPPTLQPALRKNIPLYIKNTFEASHPGTFVSKESLPTTRAVQGISSIGQIALLTLQGSGLFGVPGVAAMLFGSLAQAKINIILITQGSSEHSISFAVQPSDAKLAEKVVQKTFEHEIAAGQVDPIVVELELSVIAIIGENMRFRPGIAGRMFQALGNNGINCVAIAQGSSELNLSVVIHRTDETKALNALHQAFFLSDTREINLFLVGPGQIGKTLVGQIRDQAERLKRQYHIEIKLAGISNSRTMVFAEDGLDMDQWETLLATSSLKADLGIFVSEMQKFNLPNAIFVDNTASAEVASHYLDILSNSVSISSANKIAASSDFSTYSQLKERAALKGVSFGFETNVGAGLPIINTLNDLLDSGDNIIAIEGVLSGTISFLFNTFDGSMSFSNLVRDAQRKGYTEPDPREDLSGADIRRKLLILAREAGYSFETNDIEIVPLLPAACMEAPTVAAFYETLLQFDDHFKTLWETAAANNKRLRVVAALRDGKGHISLQAVDADHPFYQLSGTDNMIAFTTQRYHQRPLVIRGAGAGAEVTAAGVFAEILRIGQRLGQNN